MIKKKKRIMIISIIISLIILIVVALYVNLKVFTVKKVLMEEQQEVYIMGTFHKEHFEQYANYSIEEMIGYWEITNDSKTNTTTDERDDRIHNNIMEKLADYKNKRILVICGFGHLSAQTERLIAAGGQNQHISHKSDLFKGENEDFVYPSLLCDVWEERVLFYAHTIPQLVQENNALNEETKANWPEDVDGSFYNWQMEYCKLFEANNLYID